MKRTLLMILVSMFVGIEAQAQVSTNVTSQYLDMGLQADMNQMWKLKWSPPALTFVSAQTRKVLLADGITYVTRTTLNLQLNDCVAANPAQYKVYYNLVSSPDLRSYDKNFSQDILIERTAYNTCAIGVARPLQNLVLIFDGLKAAGGNYGIKHYVQLPSKVVQYEPSGPAGGGGGR